MLTRETWLPTDVRADLWEIDQKVDELVDLVVAANAKFINFDTWPARHTVTISDSEDMTDLTEARQFFLRAIGATESNLSNLNAKLLRVREYFAGTRQALSEMQFDSYKPDRWSQRGFSVGLNWDSPYMPSATKVNGFDRAVLGPYSTLRRAHTQKWKEGFEAGYSERQALGHVCRLKVINWNGFSDGLI